VTPIAGRRGVVLAILVGVLVVGCDPATASQPPGVAGLETSRPASGAGGSIAPGGLVPSGQPSSTPPSGGASPTASGPPATAYDQVKFGFAAKGLRGEVMAFVTTSQVDDALRALDFATTSTIAFFSLEATGSGAIRHDGRWRIWNSANVDELIARAHASGTKVVISLARFSWSAAQRAVSTDLLGSAAARARLAGAFADEVVRHGVDGINVDFEPVPIGQKANFTDLVRRLRVELDRRGTGYQLTFDVVGHFESYDVGGALRPGGADAVYLMGYHYAGTFSTIAHGTAPLGGPRYDVGDAIRGLRKVAAPHQLIVGVPYYGHVWPTKSGVLNARTVGAGHDVTYATARTVAAARGSTYDQVEEVSRVTWRERACASCPLQWFQLYYDDPRSLAVKWAEFRRQGLLGTGIWTSAFEGPSGDLDAALRSAWMVDR
jgi:spore germination protein YaaH